MRRLRFPIRRITKTLRYDPRCALFFHHRRYVGRRKPIYRTCGKDPDAKAMGRQLTEAYYSCVRTSSRRPANNGRQRYGNRTGIHGLPKRGIEASSIRKDSFSFGSPRCAERRTHAAIDEARARPRNVARSCGSSTKSLRFKRHADMREPRLVCGTLFFGSVFRRLIRSSAHPRPRRARDARPRFDVMAG
jgi:hypothetical protein